MDEEIEAYLRKERLSRALRILWAGLAALLLGIPGTWLVYRWYVDGGVATSIELAAPFLVLVGAPLTAYGVVALVRAR